MLVASPDLQRSFSVLSEATEGRRNLAQSYDARRPFAVVAGTLGVGDVQHGEHKRLDEEGSGCYGHQLPGCGGWDGNNERWGRSEWDWLGWSGTLGQHKSGTQLQGHWAHLDNTEVVTDPSKCTGHAEEIRPAPECCQTSWLFVDTKNLPLELVASTQTQTCIAAGVTHWYELCGEVHKSTEGNIEVVLGLPHFQYQ